MKKDHRGRTGSHSARPTKRRSGSLDGPFIAHRREMLSSYAFAALSLAARRCLDRLEVEHMNHAGRENGNLIVTYADFEAFGIRRSSVSAAIRELEALGFIEITFKGRGGNAEFRKASKYRITHQAAKGQVDPTDEWRNSVVAPRNIDSRPENGSGSVGPKTGPKSSIPRPESGSEGRPEKASGVPLLSDRGGRNDDHQTA